MKKLKRNGSKLGQVFYDVNDGQTKKLIQQPGTLTLGFEVVDLGGMSQAAAAEMPIDSTVVEQKVASTGMSNAQAETEAAKRGLTLLTKPEGAGRGWVAEAKAKNPEGITKTELEEIIRQEEFAEASGRIDKQGR